MEHPLTNGGASNIMEGLRITQYQAKSYPQMPGLWHAHIVPLSPRESKLGRSWYDRGLWDAAKVRPTIDPNGRPWAAIRGDTQEQMRDRLSEALGRLFAVRFRMLLEPITPPQPSTIAPPREFWL